MAMSFLQIFFDFLVNEQIRVEIGRHIIALINGTFLCPGTAIQSEDIRWHSIPLTAVSIAIYAVNAAPYKDAKGLRW